MKLDGRFYVRDGLLVSVSLSDNDALDPYRICDITIWVFLDDNFDLHDSDTPGVQPRGITPSAALWLSATASSCAGGGR
jgi:hypothetical protein